MFGRCFGGCVLIPWRTVLSVFTRVCELCVRRIPLQSDGSLPWSISTSEPELTSFFLATKTTSKSSWFPTLEIAAHFIVDENFSSVYNEIVCSLIALASSGPMLEFDESVSLRQSGHYISNQSKANYCAVLWEMLQMFKWKYWKIN